MPTYEYQCLSDGHRFEVRHGINEEPISVCEICGGAVRRVVQPVGIVFKGSGFYATDSKNSTTSVKPAAGSSESKESNSESSGETKADGKQEAKAETTTHAASESSNGTPKESTKTGEKKSTAARDS